MTVREGLAQLVLELGVGVGVKLGVKLGVGGRTEIEDHVLDVAVRERLAELVLELGVEEELEDGARVLLLVLVLLGVGT